jgi:hypothetical protein
MDTAAPGASRHDRGTQESSPSHHGLTHAARGRMNQQCLGARCQPGASARSRRAQPRSKQAGTCAMNLDASLAPRRVACASMPRVVRTTHGLGLGIASQRRRALAEACPVQIERGQLARPQHIFQPVSCGGSQAPRNRAISSRTSASPIRPPSARVARRRQALTG